MAGARERLAALQRDVEELRRQMPARAPMELRVPSIIEFCLSPEYLGLGLLYPRQATLLKVMFLEVDNLTVYDLAVIGEWTGGFSLPEPDSIEPTENLHYEGEYGLAPDIFDRMKVCKALGLSWFPEVVAVGGRRGSKGVLGAIAGAYVTYRILCLGDPQAELGIAPGKTLEGLVFAGSAKQARDLQWFDLAEMIVRAKCFAPFIAGIGRDVLTLATPHDLQSGRGINAGSIQIKAKEATPMSGRGPAAYMALFDELAHVSTTTSQVTSEDLYGNTLPALDQCKGHSFIYSGSSPWQKIGAFFQNYRRGLQVDRRTGAPHDPATFVAQFSSWHPYLDWEQATEIPTLPSPPEGVPATFPPLAGAIQAYDERLRLRELQDPVRFAIEYRAQWANVMDAYLNPASVAALFRPYDGEALVEQHAGAHNIRYYAHGDPATKHDNFVWTIAHPVAIINSNVPHVVVDKIRVWRPEDFPDGKIDFLKVFADILEDFGQFNIVDASFDQYQATLIVDLLQQTLAQRRPMGQGHIHEIVHTASSNRMMADVLRPALDHGQVHCYPHKLLEDELLFLQEVNGKVDHPTSGPVKTNDAATCLMVLVERLLRLNSDHVILDQLSNTRLGAIPGRVSAEDQKMFDELGAACRPGPRRVRVGERAYPGGPKKLPRWAQSE